MSSEKGFTLIEIVIVIVVLSILATFIFTFFYFQTKTYRTMADQRKLHEEATSALERITRELRDAGSVVSDEPGVLKLAKVHGTPNDSNRFVVFFLSDRKLYRSSADSMPEPPYTDGKLMGTDISSFVITFIGGSDGTQDDAFKIDLTVERDGLSHSLSALVSPKNSKGPYFKGRHFNGDYQEVIY